MFGLELTVVDWLGISAFLVGLPAASYYPLMFARVQWWESDIGKSMFMKGMALASVFWIAIGSIVAAILDWSWYEWVKLVSYWFLVIAVWYQVVVMRRVQKSGSLNTRLARQEDGEDQ